MRVLASSFCKVLILKMFCVIFHETFLPVNMELLLTAKITPDINMLLVHTMQELQSSLHARHSFWCLIMASTKLYTLESRIIGGVGHCNNY